MQNSHHRPVLLPGFPWSVSSMYLPRETRRAGALDSRGNYVRSHLLHDSPTQEATGYKHMFTFGLGYKNQSLNLSAFRVVSTSKPQERSQDAHGQQFSIDKHSPGYPRYLDSNI